MSRADEDTIHQAYVAFNDRDIERAVALMDADVDWPDVVSGGVVHGHAGVREHWHEVFANANPRIEVNKLTPRPDRRIAVDVRQVVFGPDGETLSDDRLTHVFHIEDDLIKRMDVEPRT